MRGRYFLPALLLPFAVLLTACETDGPVAPESGGEGLAAAQAGPGSGEALQAKSVHAAKWFTCALTPDGEALCWGNNQIGQLGDGTGDSSLKPVEVSGGHRFVELSTSDWVACGRTAAGEVFCWGQKSLDQNLFTPTRVQSPVAFRSIDVALRGGCGLARDGSAWCWHRNVFGRFGNGERVGFHGMPVPVSGNLRFQSLSLGVTHACGLTEGGEAWCWGDNFFGELGADPETFTQGCGFPNDCFPEPVKVETDLRFRDIQAGAGFTCGLAQTGSVWCWGLGQTGQRGDGTQEDAVQAPRKVVGDHRFRAFDIFDGNHVFGHGCGLTGDGTAWCWGLDETGELGTAADETCDLGAFGGDGSFACSTDPVRVQGDVAFRSLSTGRGHTCGVAHDGRVWCWGLNDNGQLGDGTTVNSTEPMLVDGTSAGGQAAAVRSGPQTEEASSATTVLPPDAPDG